MFGLTKRLPRSFRPVVSNLEDRLALAGSVVQHGTTLIIFADPAEVRTVTEVRYDITEDGDFDTGTIIVTMRNLGEGSDPVVQTFSADAIDRIKYYSTDLTGDVFFNDTEESTFCIIFGNNSLVQGGWGDDVVNDYSSDGATVMDNGDNMTYNHYPLVWVE